MSCQVEQIADCGDISTLARALFINDNEDTNWLTQCALSLSSCGNLLVVGYKSRLCLLTKQWISSTDSNTFLISWSGTLPADITAVLALPICPSRQSSQHVADWFCIIVGFINGSIGFYTNTGHLLVLEKLDDKPVMKISCHTGTYGTLSDDVHIMFQSCACTVSGENLYPVLKKAKAQLAKVLAGIEEDYSVNIRKITIRKWTFAEQEELNDAVFVGQEVKNTYNHMLAMSTYQGYDVWYSTFPPLSNLILGVGGNPYIGHHYTLDGLRPPQLQDVAKVVAHKLKSALPGWLGGGAEKQAPANVPSIRTKSLLMRYGFYDSQRHGSCVVISQDRRLAAVADNFGRVAVLDLVKGHLIRLFKGYRDAQCAFLQIFSNDDKKRPRFGDGLSRALFLIIYNPKKGLIEIRLMHRGTRVAAFTATKNGLLLYNTCGLVGPEEDHIFKHFNLPDFQCVLIDPDGKLKKFVIPFFHALEGENSQRGKDLHMLRDLREHLKRSLKSEDANSADYDADLIKKASQFKSSDIKWHCIDLFVRKYEVSSKVVVACLDIFWDNIEDDKAIYNLKDIDIKNYFAKLGFVTLFFRYISGDTTEDIKLLADKIRSYFISKESSAAPDIDNVGLEDLEIEPTKERNKSEVTRTPSFKLTKADNYKLNRLLNLAQENNYKDPEHHKVIMANDNPSTYKEFVSCFKLDENSRHISLKSDIPPEKMNNLAFVIFNYIFNIDDLSSVTNYINECCIDPKDILKLLILNIMRMPLQQINIQVIEKFIEVLYYVCSAADEATYLEYHDISPWWESIRVLLVDMPCPLRTMMVAMACKAVVEIFEYTGHDSDEDVWESLSKEKVEWGLLIGSLEDISILSIILMLKDSFKGETLPKLEVTEWNINLKYIYSRGKGSVTELIAKWLCGMGVPPQTVVANELIDKFANINVDEMESEDEDMMDLLYLRTHRDLVEANTNIFKWFRLLRRQFPLSTKASYIVTNMCWEYASAWQKSMNNTEYLQSVISIFWHVSNIRLRLGLCSIIWSTFIRHTFEVTCRLVNKVGRLPKDPLCLQDVGFDSSMMIKFLKLATEYLQRFKRFAYDAEDKEIEEIVYEKIWSDTTPSLVEVAQNITVHKDIVDLNRQISFTIYAICNFNIKISKPLDTLYDIDYQYVLEALTGNVDEDRKIYMTVSERILDLRKKFIAKLIRAAVETIPLHEDEKNANPPLDYDECRIWIGQIKLVADLWDIDYDFVIREEIITKYYRGCDVGLDERVGAMKKPETLLAPVLEITTQRFKRSYEQSANKREWIVSVPPHLFIRIRNTELDPSIPMRPSLATCKPLIDKILYLMYRKSLDDDQRYVQSVKWARLFSDNSVMLIQRKL